MKFDDDNTEIGDLLRSRKPEIAVPLGLEGRILRSVGQQKHRARPRYWWRWLLVPPAVALLMVIFSPQGEEGTSPTTRLDPLQGKNEGRTTAPEDKTAIAAAESLNPLERESQALKRDAERTGRFLLNCLPSVNSATEK